MYIFVTFLSHFWHKTMTKLLFCASYICNNSILYFDVSHFLFLVQIWILIIFCVIFYLSPNIWPKNSKLTMLSTHIIKSTILSYNSTYQIALNKRCPQSSQYRNWPAYYTKMTGMIKYFDIDRVLRASY